MGNAVENKEIDKKKPKPKRSKSKIALLYIRKVLRNKKFKFAVRILVALVLSVLFYNTVAPYVNGIIATSRSSDAISKGMVLMRGAQVVTREQLVGNATWDDTVLYIKDSDNLDEIVVAAKYEVYPEEITAVSIDERGEIDYFACELFYDGILYMVELDISEGISVAEPETKVEVLPILW